MTVSKSRWMAAAIMTVVATVGMPAAAAEIVWKAMIWSPQHAATQPFETFAKEVTAKTDGRFAIEFTYGQGKPTDSLDQIRAGADAAYFCSADFAEQMPLTTVLDLPMFAPGKLSTLGRLELALADHPAIAAELQGVGVKMLIPAPVPQFQLLGTRRVDKIGDLQGARIGIPLEMGKPLAEYGAITQALSGADARAAFKNGSLDLLALPYPGALTKVGIHERSKFVISNISLGSQFCYLGANEKSWKALPAKVQEAMLGLRESTVAKYEEIYTHDAAKALDELKGGGLEFVLFSPADRARLLARAIRHWGVWIDEREKQGLKGREVFAFSQQKLREYRR